MVNEFFNPLFYFYVSEWVIRLVMLVYVPQRRNPAAARTWLLFIFVLPWPGLILYGILGRAYMTKKRIHMQEAVSRLIRTTGRELSASFITRPALSSEFMQTVKLAENLGDFPILGGNLVELLDEYFVSIDRLAADIDAAQHHVHLLFYIFADDKVGLKIEEAMARAVQRGVKCRVLIDSLGSKKWRKSVIARMREAGIEAHEVLKVRLLHRLVPRFIMDHDRVRMDLRNHRKIAVIDGQIGYTGSQNLVDPNFKEGLTYEEVMVRVTGPLVIQLQAVFLADRYFETQTTLPDSDLFPVQATGGNVAAQLLPSGPGYPQANNQRLIVSLIYAAQHRVVITTPYFIPDDALLLAMQSAVQRGVEVHLVVSQQVDQILVGMAQRSYYEDLLTAGVKIHVYKKRFLHAKHLSIDDTVALVGSSNMDLRSFLLNAEVIALFYDSAVALRLQAIQQRYFSQADELTLEQWRKRPFLTKTLQNMARLVDSLL